MAIVVETVEINGREFTHTYSDEYKKIMDANGIVYEEAYDVLDKTYTETDELISEFSEYEELSPEEQESKAYEEIGRIMMGADEYE